MTADFDFPTLDIFLDLVPRFAGKPHDPTLFSVGGKGYYENPASEILAFFFKPDGPHGMGPLFLDAFSACMGERGIPTGRETIEVRREWQTDDGGRIDFVIKSKDWLLLVENKIWHHQGGNPFDDYESSARSISPGGKHYFTILSPDGESSQRNWMGVSYREFCGELETRLEEREVGGPFSKWQLFAKEFVKHLKQEMYETAMQKDQIDFVEAHQCQFLQARKLADAYRAHIVKDVTMVLSREFPSHEFHIKDEGWGIRCGSARWGASDLVWMIDVNADDVTYGVQFCLSEPSDSQLKQTQSILGGKMGLEKTKGKQRGAEYHCWRLLLKKANREESMQELVGMGRLMDDILERIL